MASDRVITPRRRVAALSVLLAALAACGGSSTTEPTTTVPAVPSSAAATTTTTLPVTTVPVTMTVAPTTTSSTLAPTTTVDAAAVEAQIRADFERTVDARIECGVNPLECDFGAIAVAGSPEYGGLRELIASRVSSGLASRRDSGPFTVVIEVVEIVDAEDAVVTACITDGLVLYDTQGTPDPDDDFVFDDSIVSARSTWQMHLVGSWLRREGEIVAQYPGELSCDS